MYETPVRGKFASFAEMFLAVLTVSPKKAPNSAQISLNVKFGKKRNPF